MKLVATAAAAALLLGSAAIPAAGAPNARLPTSGLTVVVPTWIIPEGLGYKPGIPGGASYFKNPLNYWHTLAAGDTLHPNSAAMVANLVAQNEAAYNGDAAFNVYHYNVSFYTVDATVPRVDVIWDNCQGKSAIPVGLLGPHGQFGNVPFPVGVVTAPGGDGEIALYSPATDQIWEFWKPVLNPDGWHACWGGRMDHVSTRTAGYFNGGFGVSAAGLADFAGAVTLADMRAGSINHVMSLAIPKASPWYDVSWPAQRSDGAESDAAPDAIPEGTRFRLDRSINVDALPISPIAKMIAKAAQKYGFVVTDRAASVSVIGESGAGIAALTGFDPWVRILTTPPDYLVMRGFPWASLEALPRDYGKVKPVIDPPVHPPRKPTHRKKRVR